MPPAPRTAPIGPLDSPRRPITPRTLRIISESFNKKMKCNKMKKKKKKQKGDGEEKKCNNKMRFLRWARRGNEMQVTQLLRGVREIEEYYSAGKGQRLADGNR